MKYYFTEDEISQGLNVVEFEDLVFAAEVVCGEGKTFKCLGKAVIDGEDFNQFEIEFTLLTELKPKDISAGQLFQTEWDEYDYIFPV